MVVNLTWTLITYKGPKSLTSGAMTILRQCFSNNYLVYSIKPQYNVACLKIFFFFSGSGGRTAKGITLPSTSCYFNCHNNNFQTFWPFVFSPKSSRDPRTFCTLISFGSLLQYGHVSLRSRQVNIFIYLFFWKITISRCDLFWTNFYWE